MSIGLLVISLAGSAPAQEVKPDFKMDSEEFAKEVYKDPEAALKKYKGKKVELTGLVANAGKTYTPKGFSLRSEVKARALKMMFDISFEVDLPAEQREQAWTLKTKQKVIVTAELAEVTDNGIRLTNATYKKAE